MVISKQDQLNNEWVWMQSCIKTASKGPGSSHSLRSAVPALHWWLRKPCKQHMICILGQGLCLFLKRARGNSPNEIHGPQTLLGVQSGSIWPLETKHPTMQTRFTNANWKSNVLCDSRGPTKETCGKIMAPEPLPCNYSCLFLAGEFVFISR